MVIGSPASSKECAVEGSVNGYPGSLNATVSRNGACECSRLGAICLGCAKRHTAAAVSRARDRKSRASLLPGARDIAASINLGTPGSVLAGRRAPGSRVTALKGIGR